MYSVYSFFGSLYFFVMFQSYRELVIMILQFAYRNMFSRFLTFNNYNWRSNQPWHIDKMFSQTVNVMKKNHKIDINTCIKLYLIFKFYQKWGDMWFELMCNSIYSFDSCCFPPIDLETCMEWNKSYLFKTLWYFVYLLMYIL